MFFHILYVTMRLVLIFIFCICNSIVSYTQQMDTNAEQNVIDSKKSGNNDSIIVSNKFSNAERLKIIDDDITLLSSLNCNTSNNWNVSLTIETNPSDEFEKDAILANFFTYKTAVDGRNSGVIMNLYNIKHEAIVREQMKRTYKSTQVMFLTTKNYIIYINYGIEVNDKYDKLVQIFLTELKSFLHIHSEEL